MFACTLARKGRISWPRGLRLGGRAVGAVLALVVAVGSGCAVQHNLMPTAAAPSAKARTEIAELEKSIADHKAGLRGAADEALTGAPTAPESAASPMSAGTAPSARCDGVCRAGQEICTASRRICKIAAQATDDSLTASCQRAERECTAASALCAQCH